MLHSQTRFANHGELPPVRRTKLAGKPDFLCLDSRVNQLDVLRGLAVLGILLMNIQSFSMVLAAYEDPIIDGGLTYGDLAIWIICQVFANMKFMNLFSFLYGAGIYLFCSRLETRGHPPLYFFMRRSFVLLIVGLVHGFGFWSGDILFSYALCGLAVVGMRKWSSQLLLLLASIAMIIPFAFLFSISALKFAIMTDADRALTAEYRNIQAHSQEQNAYRGSYLEQWPQRKSDSITMQTIIFPFYTFWRSGSLMILGMLAMRSGLLRAQHHSLFRHFALWGTIVGTLGGGFVAWACLSSNFDPIIVNLLSPTTHFWASLFMSTGYLGLIYLWTARGGGAWLASVGRMAFTNYLAQTLICTTLFYGHGFGLYGSIDRLGQFLITLSIWIIQIAVSHLWLARFPMGPLEWFWRVLTYGYHSTEYHQVP